ncbi:MAG: peptidoglycan editing factor PgeF [Patescibacteria group bacterium]|jgi:hypothetical protein
MQKVVSQKLSKHNNLIQGLAIGDFGHLKFGDDGSENNIEKVVENRKKYFDIFGIDLKKVVMQNQVHGTHISLVSKKDCGKGVFSPDSYIDNSDGLVTKDKNVFLVCYTADCLPVTFFDPKLKICGIAHSGWKGTLGNISGKMIGEFKKMGSNVLDIIVYIGPAIGKCCYEVSEAKDDRIKLFENLAKEFKADNFVVKENDKIYLDLKRIVKTELLDSGVKNENIEISKICTSCDDKFPSYHRDKDFKSDLLSVIGMK